MKNQHACLAYNFMLSIVLLFSGCTIDLADPKASDAETILKGTHPLRRMVPTEETNSNLSGGYFLFYAEIKGETQTSQLVKFAWLMNDGISYSISSLPLEKIRVQFNDTISVPTIRYRWKWASQGLEDIQLYMDNFVHYAVVTVREEDWPVQINLPLNNDTLR